MRKRFLQAATVLLSISGTAYAGTSLRVQPLSVNVEAPSQASAITLQNTSANEVSLQLRIFEWTQVNGVDRLTPTTDVVVSPPVTTIPGGAAYTVRVARTAGAVASGEKGYRLWIDELPVAQPQRAAGRAVDVRIRYDLPVFFGAPGTASKLSWKASRSAGRLVVDATNNGTAHARITGLKVGATSFGEGLNGYVLPGSTRRWTAPAGTALPAANSSATLSTGVGDRAIREELTIVEN